MSNVLSDTIVSQQDVASLNRRAILELLRKHDTLSRQQIAQITGLTRSAMTYITRDMMDRHILQTAGKKASGKAGPKQILLRINPDFGYAAGISLYPDHTTMMLLNAGGQCIDECEIKLNEHLEHAPALLRQGLDQRIAKLGLQPDRLLGIAVGLPGIVNINRGVVLNSMPFNVRNFPLRALLEQHFPSVPIIVDHDANMAALAEWRRGAAQGLSNFIYVMFNWEAAMQTPNPRAFGAALFFHGQIYHGVNFAAGEIDASLKPYVDFPIQEHDYENIASQEQPLTARMEDFALAIGKCLAVLANLLDPQVIVFASDRQINNTRFIEQVSETAHERLLPIDRRRIPVKLSPLTEQSVALGAALSVLGKIDEKNIAEIQTSA